MKTFSTWVYSDVRDIPDIKEYPVIGVCPLDIGVYIDIVFVFVRFVVCFVFFVFLFFFGGYILTCWKTLINLYPDIRGGDTPITGYSLRSGIHQTPKYIHNYGIPPPFPPLDTNKYHFVSKGLHERGRFFAASFAARMAGPAAWPKEANTRCDHTAACADLHTAAN
jgi:hypothetical protein